MQKYLNFSFTLFFLIGANFFTAKAHNPNEAFFIISPKGKTVEIEAEFPYSMRNALLAYEPSLETEPSKEAFKTALFKYVKDKLILKNTSGGAFSLLRIDKLPQTGHSHQTNMLFVFEGSDLYEISNEIMFNVSEKQKNYHTILIGGIKKTFYATKDKPSFLLTEPSVEKQSWWWLLLILLPLGYIFRKKYLG